MKTIATSIVMLFAVSAFANSPAAPAAATTPAAPAAPAAHATVDCKGKTGKDLDACKAEAKKTADAHKAAPTTTK